MALNELRIVVVDGGKVEAGQSQNTNGQGKPKKKTDATPKTRVTYQEKINEIKRKKKAGVELTKKEIHDLREYQANKIDKARSAIRDPLGSMQSAVSRKYTAIAGAVVGLGVQFAKQSLNYYVSNIGRRNGDSNYQAIVNRKIEIANEIMNLTTSTLGGAAAGFAVGGPVGAAVGVITGLASTAINIGFRQYEREKSYQHEMFRQNTSQAYNLSRANYSAYTGRVR